MSSSSGRNGKVFGPRSADGSPSSAGRGSAASSPRSGSPSKKASAPSGRSAAATESLGGRSGRSASIDSSESFPSARRLGVDEKAGKKSKSKDSKGDGDEKGKSSLAVKGSGDRKGKNSPNPSLAEGTVFAALPRLKDTPPEEQAEVLGRKIRECCTIYDFKNAETNLPEKEGKRLTLLEIVEHANSPKGGGFSDSAAIRDAVEMVAANLFRVLVKKERFALDLLDPEGDEPTLDPAWTHLEIVYELIQRLVTSKDIENALVAKHVDAKFMLRLLDLFESEDPRERDCLKLLLKSIYGKFTPLRSGIRRAIQNICLKTTCEDGVQNGVGELLEIMARIIHGFSSPLKEDNRAILLKVLIPMHKIEWVGMFHSHLVDCVKRFIDKDNKLTYDVVMALLRFWPFSCGSKQILFIGELEDILQVTPQAEFKRVNAALAKRLAICVSCPNSDVAERALALWRNDRVMKLITQNCRDQFPVIISALYKNSTQHWHSSVHTHTIEVLKMMMEADPELFDASSAKHRKEAEEEERRETVREQKWRYLEGLHAKKASRAAGQRPSVKVDQKPLRREDVSEEPPPVSPNAALSPRSQHSPALTRETSLAKSGPPKLAVAPNRQPSSELMMGGMTAEENGCTSPKAEAAQKPQNGSLSMQPRGLARQITSTVPKIRDETELCCERYGFVGSWRSQVDLGLQALVVDHRGKIIDVVHDQNVLGQSAMVFRPSSGEAERQGGVVWFGLSRLPDSVAALVFVVAAHSGGHLSEAACTAQLVEETVNQTFVDFAVDGASGDACMVCAVKRVPSAKQDGGKESSEGAWRMVRIEECAKSSRHYMEMLDPVLSKLIREVIPGVPKRQKANVALSSLAAGGVACLPQPTAAKWLFVGLGWDLAPEVISDAAAAGFAVALVFMDGQGRNVGAVSADNAEEHGSRHSGAGTLGGGAIVDLANAPQDVSNIIFVGHLPHAGEAKIGGAVAVQSPHLCVIDPLGSELVRYNLDREFAESEHRGLAVARLWRDRQRGRWCLQALAVPCGGNNWRESLSDLSTISRTPLHEFQAAPQENWETCQRTVISL